MARSNHLIEEPAVTGYAGPNVDLSQLYARWASRAGDLRPEWVKQRNMAKLRYLPKPVGTVDQHSGWFGASAVVTPILRALPSWDWHR